MSGSPSRPVRVLPGALLGLVAAPSGLLAVPGASAAERVEVQPLSQTCGVRLDLRGLPARAFTVQLDLVARHPEQPLALTPPGAREVDGGRPSLLDVTAAGLSGATASRAYQAVVTLDGEVQPPVELLLPGCADPATATASPTVTATGAGGSSSATPSPSGPSPSSTAGPARSGSATPSPADASPASTAGPGGSGSATPSPSGPSPAGPSPVSTAGPATSPVSATSTATIDPGPTPAPVFGPRSASAPSTGGSGVVALSGVAAAPVGALPELAAPPPVVAPPAGGVAAAVAAAPPLAAGLPALPGRPGPVAAPPAPETIAPEVVAAPPDASGGPAAVNGTWTAGLPAALLLTGAAAGSLGLRLRRRRPQNL